MSRLLKSFAVLTVITAAFAMTADAQAGHCHDSYPQYTWKAVTVYQTVRQPKVITVTLYDHCDRPYLAHKTVWTTHRVPVTKYVKVAY
ncbi:MAG: hypothetical protein R3C59_19355 [Planctomycetaceae bacterium]